jgi:hypothetical protein
MDNCITRNEAFQVHQKEQAHESRPYGTESPSLPDKNSNLNPCQACSAPVLWDRTVIGFNNDSADLCDKCNFVHDVVKAAIARKILRVSGTRQEIHVEQSNRRRKPTRTSSERARNPRWNTWTDFHWKIWNNQPALHPLVAAQFRLIPNYDSGSPKPFPDLPEKPLSYDTSSSTDRAKVQAWLKLCQETHKTCAPQQPELALLPHRVIDVSANQIRLVETDKVEGQYVCLSHCWGTVLPSCRTTSETLASNKRNIAWDTLPETFQDAIDFTRRLGFEYIWVDSICIIQDDSTDWAWQSSCMASIYATAVVTLCATASSHDDGGCYSAPPPIWRPHEFRISTRDGIEYEVYMRCDLDQRHIPEWHQASTNSYAPNLPLMSRGWTYQERPLSRRLVHFVAGEVMWECSELSDCGCFQGEIGRSAYMKFHSPKHTTGERYVQTTTESWTGIGMT